MTIRPFHVLAALSAAFLATLAMAPSAAAQACYDFESEMPHIEGEVVYRSAGPVWAPTAEWTYYNMNPPASGLDPFYVTQDDTGDMSLMPFGNPPIDTTVQVRGTFRINGSLPMQIDLGLHIGVTTEVFAYRSSPTPPPRSRCPCGPRPSRVTAAISSRLKI